MRRVAISCVYVCICLFASISQKSEDQTSAKYMFLTGKGKRTLLLHVLLVFCCINILFYCYFIAILLVMISQCFTMVSLSVGVLTSNQFGCIVVFSI